MPSFDLQSVGTKITSNDPDSSSQTPPSCCWTHAEEDHTLAVPLASPVVQFLCTVLLSQEPGMQQTLHQAKGVSF